MADQENRDEAQLEASQADQTEETAGDAGTADTQQPSEEGGQTDSAEATEKKADEQDPGNDAYNEETAEAEGKPEQEPKQEPAEEVTPEQEPAEEVTPEQEPAEEVTPEQEPAEEVKPEQEPAEEVTPEQEPTEEVTPEQEPAEEVTPEQEPAEEVTPEQEPAEDGQIVENGTVSDLNLSEDQLETFRYMFKIHSEDDRINFEQFKRLLRCAGHNPTSADAQSIYDEADKDGNGTINFEEFCRLHAAHTVPLEDQETEIVNCINKVFPGNQEEIPLRKVEQIMEKVGLQRDESCLTRDDLHRLVSDMDRNGNGMVDRLEFAKMLISRDSS
ncbi:probable serine/threonine-protein kinase kinX [Haliotis cracherodii]|uniref:probable serine/threonine-protein kinase kinX n=1 Tax=Haliotis cracherodii TaxID=6455 RepID=UPI0039EB73CF